MFNFSIPLNQNFVMDGNPVITSVIAVISVNAFIEKVKALIFVYDFPNNIMCSIL